MYTRSRKGYCTTPGLESASTFTLKMFQTYFPGIMIDIGFIQQYP